MNHSGGSDTCVASVNERSAMWHGVSGDPRFSGSDAASGDCASLRIIDRLLGVVVHSEVNDGRAHGRLVRLSSDAKTDVMPVRSRPLRPFGGLLRRGAAALAACGRCVRRCAWLTGVALIPSGGGASWSRRLPRCQRRSPRISGAWSARGR
jgi:hypothetical protein